MEEQEHRKMRRFNVQLPVAVKYTASGNVREMSASTKDINARGAFLYTDTKLQEGSVIEFTLTLPPEITLSQSLQVRCKGKVVRVDQTLPDAGVGTAITIDFYEFLLDEGLAGPKAAKEAAVP